MLSCTSTNRGEDFFTNFSVEHEFSGEIAESWLRDEAPISALTEWEIPAATWSFQLQQAIGSQQLTVSRCKMSANSWFDVDKFVKSDDLGSIETECKFRVENACAEATWKGAADFEKSKWCISSREETYALKKQKVSSTEDSGDHSWLAVDTWWKSVWDEGEKYRPSCSSVMKQTRSHEPGESSRSWIVYPFSIAKQQGHDCISIQENLEDINGQIKQSALRAAPLTTENSVPNLLRFSNKNVVRLTKLHTPFDGTLTIMRTKE